jgi:hypothetical protein
MRWLVLIFAAGAIVSGLMVVPLGTVNGFAIGSDRLGTVVVLGALSAWIALTLLPRKRR